MAAAAEFSVSYAVNTVAKEPCSPIPAAASPLCANTILPALLEPSAPTVAVILVATVPGVD